jgi:predicted nucleic acid-binding protein
LAKKKKKTAENRKNDILHRPCRAILKTTTAKKRQEELLTKSFERDRWGLADILKAAYRETAACVAAMVWQRGLR